MMRRLRSLFAVAVAAVVVDAGSAAAQALHMSTLANGTEVVHVTLPLSGATSVAWPTPGEHGAITTVTSGSLTLVADLEAALTAVDGPSPPVVIAVGGASANEITTTLSRLLSYPAEPAPAVSSTVIVDGRIERRLARAGSEARLRLDIALPATASWRRSTIEVLWELLPELLVDELPGMLVRTEGDRAVLEALVDADLVELKLDRLRLALARIGAEPGLEGDRVEAVRRRLMVRRCARLESHPEAAELLVGLWLGGGNQAVREYLFGLDGVRVGEVARAAREWLPQHPGSAVLILPPRVFSPRFAAAPRLVQLDDDLAAAILERPGSPLATLCLRPVLTPDIDGAVAATVLARLAAELRSSQLAPGWIRVDTPPAVLELAAPLDGFAELVEALQSALKRVAGDGTGVSLEGGDARRRALQMVAGHLGLAEPELSPTELLSPRNLALGVVAADGEAAEHALRKLLAGWAVGGPDTGIGWLGAGQRTREVAPGNDSVLVAVLPLAGDWGWVEAGVVTELLRQRCVEHLPQVDSELLRPLAPGRRVLLLVLRAEGELGHLEQALTEAWAKLVAEAQEETLAPMRRRVAAAFAAEAGGSLGRARWVAAAAAGQVPWRPPGDVELQVLAVSVDEVATALEAWKDLSMIATFGAGVLPIAEVP